MMKKVLILFDEKNWKDKEPFDDKKAYPCYEYFYQLAEERGLKMYRASYQWYDKRRKFFKYAWTLNHHKWHKIKKIKPDIIYDKAKFNSQTLHFKEDIKNVYKIINSPDFSFLLGNKLYASLLSPRYFKPYHPVKNFCDLKRVTKIIKSKKIVLKPATESGGKNITIIDKSKIRPASLSYPLLAQEFIENSAGIKNIAKGYHDLRIVFVNNKLINSFVREPARGSLLANLAQGGTMFFINPSKLPLSLSPVISEVQKLFSAFDPKIYSMDFIFDNKQKPWIVEFNTMPGFYFFSDEDKRWQKKFFLEIINLFKKELN